MLVQRIGPKPVWQGMHHYTLALASESWLETLKSIKAKFPTNLASAMGSENKLIYTKRCIISCT